MSFFQQSLGFLERTINDQTKKFWNWSWMFFWPALNLMLVGSIALFVGDSVDLGLLGMSYLEFSILGAIVSTFAGFAFEQISSSYMTHIWNQALPAIIISPTKRLAMFFGELMYSFFAAVMTSLTIYFVANALFGFAFAGNLLLMVLVAFFILFSLFGLGIVLAGFTLLWKRADVVSELLSFLVMLSSGIYYPIANMPWFLAWMTPFSPVTYGLEAMRGLYVGSIGLYGVLIACIILSVFGVVNLFIGDRFYKWCELRALQKGTLRQH